MSGQPGYTYHLNCGQHCGPLTPTPGTQPYLDTAVATSQSLSPNVIHSFYNSPTNAACISIICLYVVKVFSKFSPAAGASELRELNWHFRLDTQSYKQQQPLSGLKERLTYFILTCDAGRSDALTRRSWRCCRKLTMR